MQIGDKGLHERKPISRTRLEGKYDVQGLIALLQILQVLLVKHKWNFNFINHLLVIHQFEIGSAPVICHELLAKFVDGLAQQFLVQILE